MQHASLWWVVYLFCFLLSHPSHRFGWCQKLIATTTSVRNEREIGPGKEVGPGQGICHDSVVIAQAQTIIRDGVGRPAPKKLYTAFLMTLVEPEVLIERQKAI